MSDLAPPDPPENEKTVMQFQSEKSPVAAQGLTATHAKHGLAFL
jgi:hypothetical protein